MVEDKRNRIIGVEEVGGWTLEVWAFDDAEAEWQRGDEAEI